MFGEELFGSTPFGGILYEAIGLGVQKSLKYVVLAGKSLEKPLTYEVGYPSTHKHLPLQYRVGLRYEDKYQPKESEYTDKYQPKESEYADKYISKGTKYRQKY